MKAKTLETYNDRIKIFSDELKDVLKKIRWTAFFRFMVFVVGTALTIYLFKIDNIPAFIVLVTSITTFLAVIIFHGKLKRKKKNLSFLIDINNEEIQRLNFKTDGLDGGNEFVDNRHYYSSDLDIFGEKSLFQYLNRSATVIGKIKLATWLKNKAKKEEIEERQKAISELKDKLDWRQQFQATGRIQVESRNDSKEILDWLNKDVNFAGKRIYKFLLLFLPFITIIAFILSIFVIPAKIPILLGIFQLLFIGSHLKKINYEHSTTTKKLKLIKKYANLIAKIENESFSSERLNYLKQKLKKDNTSAGENIQKLSSIISYFDNRLNMLAAIFLNGLLLWDLQCVVRLEKWRKKYSKEFPLWFDVISEIDALSGIAGFYYNDSNLCFPIISDDNFYLKAENLGHPMIPDTERVPNDFEINGLSKFFIITGSNMAGKSTFLRTVGVNMILAMTGAPVCASNFQFSIIQIFTSMRITDDLSNRESTFYAELKRLEQIINEVEKQDVFILLDEILKGTNSKDKLKGSKALIKQLIKEKSTGIIATHDLELAKLEDEFKQNIFNYNFEVDIDKGQFNFDYKLKNGVCKILNATELMKKMGVKV